MLSAVRLMRSMMSARTFGSNVRMRAEHLDRVRNDVLANAAIDLADGDDRRQLGDVDLSADDRLQPHDDLRRGHDRIDARPRTRAVRLTAAHIDAERIGAGHERPGPITDHAAWNPGSNMQAED